MHFSWIIFFRKHSNSDPTSAVSDSRNLSHSARDGRDFPSSIVHSRSLNLLHTKPSALDRDFFLFPNY